MSVANLFNVPTTPEEWSVWSFSNMDHHRQIVRAIGDQKSISLNLYPLDPISFEAIGVFLYQHQAMHNDMDSVLSLAGFDLTDLDPTNFGQVSAFVRLHVIEHINAALALGIG